MRIPPSLLNMYKELRDDLGCFIPNNGYLIPWSVGKDVLLNTALTVRAGEANSHQNKGWEIFTDEIIKKLNGRRRSCDFCIMGRKCKKEKVVY